MQKPPEQVHTSIEELEHCRDRLIHIIARCVEGIVIADQEGIIRFVNEAALLIFRRRANEMIGLPFRFPLSPEESKELTIKLPDGKMQTVEMSVSQTLWEEKPAWLITLHDITAQRLAEKELRLLYRAVTFSPVMTIITDAAGKIVFVNPKFTELTGFDHSQVEGKLPDFLDPNKMPLDMYSQVWKAIAGGQEWHGELAATKRDGQPYWQSVYLSPVKDQEGLVTNFVAIAEDISERKKLAQEQAFLAAIVDSSDDAIIGKTLEGIITSWNHGAQAMYGYMPDEIIGRPITLLAPPEKTDEIIHILERISRGERVPPFHTERVRKDGSRLQVSLRLSPIIDTAGTIIGAAAIARDLAVKLRSSDVHGGTKGFFSQFMHRGPERSYHG
ncbi:PAS domain S-box protein [Geotalea sp. SG265]|uniref:PAS domain-containing protein n=1 Tax=Geotalea sp. SG265 TaxID=2922867 RepID=UPI001FAF76FC|nr:PAS domain S-box protein [Geotalea sp. SG265]